MENAACKTFIVLAMRYDAASQYIFNWNVGAVTPTSPNGTHPIQVDFGESTAVSACSSLVAQ